MDKSTSDPQPASNEPQPAYSAADALPLPPSHELMAAGKADQALLVPVQRALERLQRQFAPVPEVCRY